MKLNSPKFFIKLIILVIAAISTVLLLNIFSYPKLIALTFDDGPYGQATLDVLNILKQEKIPATFFLIGKNVLTQPEIVRREIEDGHVIGNHSFDHSQQIATMTPMAIDAELEQSEEAIYSVTHLRPYLFRAPYGNESPAMLDEIQKRGYLETDWTDEARDWDASVSSAEIASKILKQAKSNGIILLHDGRDTKINYPRGNMIQALPIIIRSLKRQGYTFVTVDKILKIKP